MFPARGFTATWIPQQTLSLGAFRNLFSGRYTDCRERIPEEYEFRDHDLLAALVISTS